jgi:hypothetical protein
VLVLLSVVALEVHRIIRITFIKKFVSQLAPFLLEHPKSTLNDIAKG